MPMVRLPLLRRGPWMSMRTLTTSCIRASDDPMPFSRAGPIPLPKDEQLEFERLVREKQSVYIFADTRCTPVQQHCAYERGGC